MHHSPIGEFPNRREPRGHTPVQLHRDRQNPYPVVILPLADHYSPKQ